MSEPKYPQAAPYEFTRMPAELVEIMSEISDTVVTKLGELSVVAKMADDLPPEQAALLLSAIETPGFKLKNAKNKYQALASLPNELVDSEIAKLEENLYENGVTAGWHVNNWGRRPKHELLIYYVDHELLEG